MAEKVALQGSIVMAQPAADPYLSPAAFLARATN
jgi:hypothetical protein